MEELLKNADLANFAKQFGVNDVAKEIFNNSATTASYPKYKLLDIGEAYQYHFELPGLTKENILLNRKGHSLILTGGVVPNNDGGKVVKNEFRHPTEFEREVNLESDCDQIADATFKDGILIITVSKVTDGQVVQIN